MLCQELMKMSEDDNMTDEISAFDKFGAAFEVSHDPLKAFDQQFKNVNEDPIDLYHEYRIKKQDLGDDRLNTKERTLRRWRVHMEDYERHRACANSRHVGDYINKELLKDNSATYIQKQLKILSRMFEYWANHPKMPHGTGEATGYNPVDSAYEFKIDEIKRNISQKKPQHQISVEELGHRIRNIKNILYRSVLVTQLKYGLRSGQVSNIHKSDVRIEHEELNDLYPELGTHPRIDGFDDDVIYFPPTFEREGVKSKRPIVMPIDKELRPLLVTYLRQRPPIDDPYLFLNNSNGNQLNNNYLNRVIWKPNFHPEYAETEVYDSATSHYARHRFTTYWRKKIDANPELINYMRGARQSELETGSPDVLNDYVHTYYSDIDELYLNHIYMFNI